MLIFKLGFPGSSGSSGKDNRVKDGKSYSDKLGGFGSVILTFRLGLPGSSGSSGKDGRVKLGKLQLILA